MSGAGEEEDEMGTIGCEDAGDGDGGGPSNAAMSGIDEDAAAPPPAKKAAVLSMAIDVVGG